MFKNYARLINQKKMKYQAVFSARFDKQDEDYHILVGVETLNEF